MTVIVLSFRAPPTLVAAVRSLLDQSPRPEVVVVNSGGGQARRLLELTGIHVPVFEVAERLWPGAARNLGIRNANGSVIAFLADDCEAAPGWVARRLVLHRAGQVAVASALMSDDPSNVIALASHIGLFSRRMPTCPPERVLVYGLSFDRTVFHKYGLFREDLRAGEDTEFSQRVSATVPPLWAPDIVTVHRSPTTLRAFMNDQFRRGGRSARVWENLTGRKPPSVAGAALRRIADTMRLAPRVLDARQRMRLPVIAVLVVAGAVAYAAGALRSSRADED